MQAVSEPIASLRGNRLVFMRMEESCRLLGLKQSRFRLIGIGLAF